MGVQRGPLAVYGTPQDLAQFGQQVVHVPRVATLTVSGEIDPTPQVDSTPPKFLKEVQEIFTLLLRIGTCRLICTMGLIRSRMSRASPRTSSQSSSASCRVHRSSGRCPRLQHRS